MRYKLKVAEAAHLSLKSYSFKLKSLHSITQQCLTVNMGKYISTLIYKIRPVEFDLFSLL